MSDQNLVMFDYALRIDEVADRFEAAWKSGTEPSIADYLAGTSGIRRVALLAELVRIDQDYRETIGRPRAYEDYLSQFPELRQRIDIAQQPVIDGYEILDFLGRGGMGVVYKARQLLPPRIVALKMILAGVHAAPKELGRFRTETAAIAELNHPNIVRIFHVGEQGGWPFYAMEYVEGGSLAEALSSRRWALGTKESALQAARIIHDLAIAMHYAHAHGIVHRDLKPANILLQNVVSCQQPVANAEDTETSPTHSRLLPSVYCPKVTDFGLAKELENERERPLWSFGTLSGTVLGSPSYMAPEQAAGKVSQIGPRSDIYALGAILYELLTGRPPFLGSSLLATLEQVRNEEPPPLRRLQPSVPRKLETICLQCLRKEPHQRYADAQSLADDIDRFLADKPIRAHRIGAPERVMRWIRSHRAIMLVAALIVVVLPVLWTLLGHYWMLAREAQEATASSRYESLVSRTSAATLGREIGWRRLALDDLREAIPFPAASRDVVQLRSLAAQCLCGIDLQEEAVIAEGIDVFCLAFSPDGRRLAVGENRGEPTCQVLLFEMPNLRQTHALRCETRSPRGFTGVRSLVFSPDGKWLLAGTRTGEMHAWDLSENNPRPLTRSAHKAEITWMAFHPNRGIFVSCCQDKTLKVWRHPQMDLLNTHSFPLEVNEAAFSADGSLLAVATDSWIGFYPTAGLETPGQPLPPPAKQMQGNRKLCFSPDGRILGYELDHRIFGTYFSDKANLGARSALSNGDLPAHEHEIMHLEFSANASLLVSSAGDRAVNLWDPANRRLVATLRIPGLGNIFPAFSPDGIHLVVAANQKTVVYAIDGLDQHRTLAQHVIPVRAFAFAPDGTMLACLAEEKYGLVQSSPATELTLWDPGSGRLTFWKHSFDDGAGDRWGLPSLAWNSLGNCIAWVTHNGRQLHFMNTADRKTRTLRDIPLSHSLRFSHSSNVIWGILDERLDSRHLQGRRNADQVLSLSWPELLEISRWSNVESKQRSSISGLTSLVAGTHWVVAGSSDGYTKIFDSKDGTKAIRQWQSPGGYPVQCVALSVDESLAACGTQQGVVQVVRPSSGEIIAELGGESASVESVAFSPDGSILTSGARDGTVRLWLREHDSFRELLALPHGGPAVQVSFHPTGKELAVLVQNETALRIWNLDRLRQRLAQLHLDW